MIIIKVRKLEVSPYPHVRILLHITANFTHPSLINRPRSGWPLSNFVTNQIFLETRMFWLSDNEKIMTLSFFVLIQYRSVTDRRTDGVASAAIARGGMSVCPSVCTSDGQTDRQTDRRTFLLWL